VSIKCGNAFLVEIVSGTIEPDGSDLLTSCWDGESETELGLAPAIELRVLVENSARVIAVDSDGLMTFDRPHGLSAGDEVFVWDMGGLYEAHGDRVVATAPTTKTLTLTLSTTYTQWTGGGMVRKILYGPEDMFRNLSGRVYYLVPHTVEFAPEQQYAISLWRKISLSGVTWYHEVPERATIGRIK